MGYFFMEYSPLGLCGRGIGSVSDLGPALFSPIFDKVLSSLRTGHSPLTQSYLNRIGAVDSDMCPHCKVFRGTARHIVSECPAWTATRRAILGDDWERPSVLQSNPRKVIDLLIRMGLVDDTASHIARPTVH